MIKIEFNTSNAAFDGDDLAPEAARILREIAYRIARDGLTPDEFIRDINGNTIGKWEFK